MDVNYARSIYFNQNYGSYVFSCGSQPRLKFETTVSVPEPLGTETGHTVAGRLGSPL